jgi:hypothetical protein
MNQRTRDVLDAIEQNAEALCMMIANAPVRIPELEHRAALNLIVSPLLHVNEVNHNAKAACATALVEYHAALSKTCTPERRPTS